MKRLIIAAVTLAMLMGAVALPVSADAKRTETISYTYSAGEGKTYTREMEKLGRGLVAIKTDSGMYLSWRLLDSEDNIFGSSDSNVSFKIYRDNQEIATVSDRTNYTDTSGNTGNTYSVAPVINGTEGARENALKNMEQNYFDIDLGEYKPEAAHLPRLISLKVWDGSKYKNYNYIASKSAPVGNTSDYIAADNPTFYVSDFHSDDTAYEDYEYTINDCSAADLDGDGEYELIVKWDCLGQDNSQGGVTGDVLLDAYKTDGTQLWRINLGKNIRAGAHYTQFLVYDFDGDGKAEMTCKTAPGSTDSRGEYVTKSSHLSEIRSISDAINETDYREGSGFIVTGDEYLTVFNGETGAAMDTIYYPNQRIDPYLWGDRPQDSGGNRVDRFTAAVAYMDGIKPYAVYMRGYYMRQSGGYSERQAACAVSFDGSELDCKYSFDTYNPSKYTSNKTKYSSFRSNGTYKGVDGYVAGNEKFVGEGNHNCSVADVDNDGKDEVMTGALCYELKDDDTMGVKWCTFLQHGDALHIGDYDPTHQGFEFFAVQEDSGTNSLGGSDVTLNYGMTVIDPGVDSTNTTDSAYGKLIMFHEAASDDTGRGVMANIGMGGYYQIWSSKNSKLYMSNGGTSYTSGSKNSLAQNFRIFWDGDLYDELLDGVADNGNVSVTSYNTSSKKIEQLLLTEECATANSTKKTPALTADLFGDWREELVMRLDDNSGLRVYSTTIPSDYKIKTLMHDPVYRSGVAAEQTAYNQPPHVGIYMSMRGPLTGITAEPDKASYKSGEELDKTKIKVTAAYKNGETEQVNDFTISGYNPLVTGTQTVTVTYLGKKTTLDVNVTTGFTTDDDGYITGYSGDVSAVVPSSVNGQTVKGIKTGALVSSGITQLTVYDDIEIADGSLPAEVTVVCFEGSAAYDYAVANDIKYELMKPEKYWANVTFEESGYSEYNNGDAIVVQKANNNDEKQISPLTFTTLARNDLGDGKSGIYKVTSGTNNYIEGKTGQWNTANRHAFIAFDNSADIKGLSQYALSFDFMIPTNDKSMSIALLSTSDGLFADAGKVTNGTNTVYALQANKDSVAADKWYHYELEYSDGQFAQTITSDDGSTILTPALNTNQTPLSIAFRSNGDGASAYVDNIVFISPVVSELTVNVKDSEGTPVEGAEVMLDGGNRTVTDSEGKAVLTALGGKHTITASYTYFDSTAEETIVVYTDSHSKTLSFVEKLPSDKYEVLEVISNSVKVNTPNHNDAVVYAVKYDGETLSKVEVFNPTKAYTNTFDEIGFEPDAVYIWSKKYMPLALWRKDSVNSLYNVKVTVTDKYGIPVSNATVKLVEKQNSGDEDTDDGEIGDITLAAAGFTAATDENGVADFTGVPAGSYRVMAVYNGNATTPQSITLQSVKNITCTIKFKKSFN